MSSSTIDILGKLNSITSDHVLADASQIEVTLDGVTQKIPAALTKCVKYATDTEIASFISRKESGERVFICSSSIGSNTGYSQGHIYYYNNLTMSDITPATGSSGSGGNVNNGVELNITYATTEIPYGSTISIPILWNSQNRGSGTVYCLVDGVTRREIRMTPGSTTWTVSSLSKGTHTLSVYVLDSGSQMSSKWELTVLISALELKSSFSSNAIYSVGDNVDITYTPTYTSDSVSLELMVKVDSDEYTSSTVTVASDSIGKYTLVGLPEGVHTVLMYLKSTKSSGSVETSSVLSFSIVIASQNKLYVIQTSSSTITATVTDSISFGARCIYIGASTFSVKFRIRDSANNEITDSAYALSDETWYNNQIGTKIVSKLPGIGTYYYDIIVSYISGDTTIASETVTYTVNSVASTMETINPIVDSTMTLYLTTSGRSNSEIPAVRSSWLNNADTSTAITLNNFNFSSNGWMTDSNGESCLSISAGAYVEINLQPFSKEFDDLSGRRGMTFDIEFSTEDVLDSSARVVSCYTGNRGFWIDTEYATLAHSNTTSETTVESSVVTIDGTWSAVQVVDSSTYTPGDNDLSGVGAPTTDTEAAAGTYYLDTSTNILYLKGSDITYTNYITKSPFQTNFQQNEKTHITFVVNAYNEYETANTNNYEYPFTCMCIYVNGVLTEIEEISTTDFFRSNAKIYLGCDNNLAHTGSCNIYNIKAYNRALKMNEIVQNVISDIRDASDQDAAIKENGLSSTSNVSNIPVMKMVFKEADYLAMSKADKKYGRIIYSDPNDNTKSFSKYIRCQWQGTSTLAYAVKNYKIKLYDEMTVANNAYTAKTKYKYDLGNGIAENTFCLKADYMDSSKAHNTGTAKYVADMTTELCPGQIVNNASRTTIYGFPVLLYIIFSDDVTKDNFDDEEAAGKSQFMGVYNFNLDKSSTDSLGLFDKGDKLYKNSDKKDLYPNWDCISFEGSANSDTTAGAFNLTYDDTTDDTSIVSDFELRYEDPEDITSKQSYGLYEVSGNQIIISNINSDINGTYNISGNTLVEQYGRYTLTRTSGADISGTTLVDPTLTQEVYETNYIYNKSQKLKLIFYKNNSTDADGNEYNIIANETNALRINRRYSHIKKLLQWVMACSQGTTESDAKFKAEFQKHFNLSATIDYYCIVLVLLMVDNFGKNVMWNTWGPAPTTSTLTYTAQELKDYDNYIWYPQFYDMDTCLGLDNSGNKRFDVSEEITQGVFNTSNSRLWKTFARVFESEIRARYIALRQTVYEQDESGNYTSIEKSSFTYDSLMKYYYTEQISKISISNYNFDMMNKYLTHKDYLYMCHGRQLEFLKRFFEQRLYFLDTMFESGDAYNAQATVRVQYDHTKYPVSFSIQTYYPAYVKIIFRNTQDDSGQLILKVPRHGTVEFSKEISTSTDQEIKIFNAGNIKSLGDISRYSPKAVLVGAMTKLTELQVGTEDYPNPNLTELALSNNTYLTKLVAEYCTALDKSVDVSKCINLQEISTVGSAIPAVTFNSSGSALTTAKFSKNTTSVIIKNCSLLNSVTFPDGMDKLAILKIVNCPKLLGYYNSDTDYQVGYFWYNVLNDWSISAADYDPTNPDKEPSAIEIELSGYGRMSKFSFLDKCANLYDSDTDNIQLSGRINYTGTSIPDKYSVYRTYWPDLTVVYPSVNNVSNMFENYKNINAIFGKDVDIVDPNTNETTTVTEYFWTDPKASKYSEVLDDAGDRPIAYYDDDDQELVADQIKEALSVFSKFTDMDAMFLNDEYIEKIHPDTFDHIEVSGASTNRMFYNCKNLKYLEFPKVSSIDYNALYNCMDTIIYIPNTVVSFNDYAFVLDDLSDGKHQTLLFQGSESDYSYLSNRYIRDAIFNVKRGDDGRAMQRGNFTCENTYVNASNEWVNETKTLCFDYFIHNDDNSGKLIYKIYNLDDDNNITTDLITFTNFNTHFDSGVVSYDTNPLNIYGLLPHSMSNFSTGVIKELAIPTMQGNPVIKGSTVLDRDIYREEGSIGRLFFDEVTTSALNILLLDKVYVLTDYNTKISRHFFNGTSIPEVIVGKQLTTIEEYAFNNSKLKTFTLTVDPGSSAKLTTIGDYAFYSTKIGIVDIPNSVTSIGEFAYAMNQSITYLHYSENMTYVPICCFKGCDTGSTQCGSISGFSRSITNFDTEAFNGATGLLLMTIPDDAPNDTAQFTKLSDYKSWFTGDPDTSHVNTLFGYFNNVTNIGNYAFRGIKNIRHIEIGSNIEFIGVSAFDPITVDEVMNNTLIEWTADNSDYGNLEIANTAFAKRNISWFSRDYNGYTGLLQNTVFIPSSVKTLGVDVFSADTASMQTLAELDFVITNAESKPDGWNSQYVTNQVKTLYDFKAACVHSEYQQGASGNIASNALYLLTNTNLAYFAKLLKLDNGECSVTLTIPQIVEFNGDQNKVIEMIDRSLIENDTNLISLIFNASSEIEVIGKELFDTTTLLNLYVDDTGKEMFPSTVAAIGGGTPYRDTQWFKAMLPDTGSDIKIVYSNGVCFGCVKSDSTTNVGDIDLGSLNINTIYDSAFNDESTLTSITFPSTLTQINYRSFRNCTALESIDFSPCRDSFTYIGSEALYNCSALQSIVYTSKITHIGSNAIGNTNISSIMFENGCSPDVTSTALCPKVGNGGKNNTITTLKLARSTGEFFTPTTGSGASELELLTNIKTLILGEYSEDTEHVTGDDDTGYSIKLTDVYPSYFTEEELADEDTIATYTLALPSNVFLMPSTDDSLLYNSPINLSNLKNDLTEYDIFRIVMGFSTEKVHYLYVNRTVATQISAGKFMRFFGSRVATIIQ